MIENKTSPLLIVGAHRSGTTFLGNMISLSTEVCYIRDPFAKYRNAGLFQLRPLNYFTYINEENGSSFINSFEDIFKLKYSIVNEFKLIKKISDFKPLIRDIIRIELAKIRKQRVLLKAATALFSAEWIVKNFNADIIGIVRHPAAFISSLKRLDITHPFNSFTNKTLLMNDHLQNFKSKIYEYSEKQNKTGRLDVPDIVDQGILLWNIIYSFMLKMKSKHPEWLVIKHEDISKSPLEEFEQIYKYCNLRYTSEIKQKILDYTSPVNPAEAVNGQWNSLKRNSVENIRSWKNRLTEPEIEKIRVETADVAKYFYSDNDW